MSAEEFLQFANSFPEALLLVTAEGTVVAANQGAGRRFGSPPPALRGRRLQELVTDPPDAVREYLTRCSRTREPALGSLTLRIAGGPATPCRAEGALLQPRAGAAPALVRLRLIPRAEQPSQFAILSQRIQELTEEIARRRRVEEELRAHREWLRVTLASIGDAVITTDDVGAVTFMNSVAQFLTGWRQEEAQGRSLDHVFRIVNEQTRAPVEHPVTKVIREGQIVGLANHTLLISRTGAEHPIDDSAAPIQDDEGRPIGVVLIFREVAERRAMERELRERAAALAAAARRRDEFLTMLAHELRNPLAPIRNAVELFKQLGQPDPRLDRARDVIERQVRHQSHLIDQLLDVARVTEGRLRLTPARLDLTQLVRDTTEDYRDLTRAAELSLTVELPEAAVWVEGDRTRLTQVLGNLLSNAVKFTNPGGRISVRLLQEEVSAAPRRHGGTEGEREEWVPTRAVLTVRDTGIGIDAEILPHIFEPFAQADRTLDRSRGGLGLGLALVKGLVELHGGRASVESAGLGEGAAFIVSLPLAAAPVPPEKAVDALDLAPEPMRVLLVEDNRDTALTLRDLLELAGYRVEVAESGPAALEAATHFQPQVVLCDLGLPGMDGFTVARRLRALPAAAAARLIAISGYGEEETRQRAREAGFDRLLTKPVEFAELRSLLESGPEP